MEQQQFDIVRKKSVSFSEPPLYEVLIFNDDVTTIDFVFMVLSEVFGKTDVESEVIINEAQVKGSAVVGVYSLDIAQTKVNKASVMAKNAGFPLRLEAKKR